MDARISKTSDTRSPPFGGGQHTARPERGRCALRAACVSILLGWGSGCGGGPEQDTPPGFLEGDAGLQATSEDAPPLGAAAVSPMEGTGIDPGPGSTPQAGEPRATDPSPSGESSDGGRDTSGDDTDTAGSCSGDACPHAGGVAWICQRRFLVGMNYAWGHFGGDFGGIAQWGQGGVAAERDWHDQRLSALADHGAQLVRWWVFPEFRGEGVRFGSDGLALGLGESTAADLQAALDLAARHDLYLMPTLFSFDNFRPSGPTREGDLYVTGIQPMVVDSARREALIERVVRPLARAAEESAHAERLLAWDLINEPEWAIEGASLHGEDPDFDPQLDRDDPLQTVSHSQMERFLRDLIVALREESGAMITVGAAAMKWRHAWSQLELDFDQFHIYGWVQRYWPYDRSPSDYGLRSRPVVMGEFFMTDDAVAPGVGYLDLVQSWFDNGYGGALGWQYNEVGPAELQLVQMFADDHGCATRLTL